MERRKDIEMNAKLGKMRYRGKEGKASFVNADTYEGNRNREHRKGTENIEKEQRT